jgi:hypothetical protein
LGISRQPFLFSNFEQLNINCFVIDEYSAEEKYII